MQATQLVRAVRNSRAPSPKAPTLLQGRQLLPAQRLPEMDNELAVITAKICAGAISVGALKAEAEARVAASFERSERHFVAAEPCHDAAYRMELAELGGQIVQAPQELPRTIRADDQSVPGLDVVDLVGDRPHNRVRHNMAVEIDRRLFLQEAPHVS
jgi:hypothetical protein